LHIGHRFSSDRTVYAAVTRATLDGKNPGGWFPEQRLTAPETIEAYTMGSAYAEFQEKEKGSITPGKLADMVLLSDDILSIAPERIRDTSVLKTILGGKLVFDSAAAATAAATSRSTGPKPGSTGQ
jgi:predicted amidohydrolase YtcJ